jgi:hypothetical protein
MCRSSVPQEAHSLQPAQVETPVPSLAHLDQIFRYGRILRDDDSMPELTVERASSADAKGIILPFDYLPRCQQVYIDGNGFVRGFGWEPRR